MPRKRKGGRRIRPTYKGRRTKLPRRRKIGKVAKRKVSKAKTGRRNRKIKGR